MEEKQKVEEWLGQLSLEEKASICSGADTWHLQEVKHLGIPGIMVSDGPHGLRKQEEKGDALGIYDSISTVCYPAACAGASSFDTELMERLGGLLGEECRAEQVSILLGPAVNIKRSPLCGRNFEYFSEDPYLTGKLAAAYIRGVQSRKVGTSIKHFAVNNQETMRQTVSAEVSEQALREIYLTGFEIAVKEAEPWTVMCSYNRINGVYASENKKLLTEILRDEWGFDGFVMSDWGAVCDRVKGILAGLDLEMPSSGDRNDKKIIEAVKTGILPEEVLNETVRRILKTVWNASEAKAEPVSVSREEHHQAAVEMAEECAVLLKNNGALPLAKSSRIVYFGSFAKQPRYQGGGSSHINAYRVEDAFSAAVQEGCPVCYYEGYPKEELPPEEKKQKTALLLQEAVCAAKEAECAVIFAGLPEAWESEGYDRSQMRLPEEQNALIEAVAAVQKNTVVVLHNGSPVELPWLSRVNAVLELYLAGEGAGKAAHHLLYGDANPSGRLAESFPFRLEHTPSYLNFPGQDRRVVYAEDCFVGYRYYEKKCLPVCFPFGHGLSYTSFAYENLKLSEMQMEKGSVLKVWMDIVNTGSRPGKEVVQLYIADRTGTAFRPEKELKGFTKLMLQPGERKTAEFTLDFRSIAWYNEAAGDWYAAPGDYEILIGKSSAEICGTAKFSYLTKEMLPFSIDSHTTIGELLADERTREYTKAVLKRLAAALGQTGVASMPKETVSKMAAELPLSSVRAFLHCEDEEFDQMLQNWRELVEDDFDGSPRKRSVNSSYGTGLEKRKP